MAQATAPRQYGPDAPMPDDYRDLVVRLIHGHALIECEYLFKPEKLLARPQRLAPTAELKTEYGQVYADELRHATAFYNMLIDLGITLTEDDFERGPHPLYIFDMRDAATTWVEWCWFFFFADRNGIYQARQWIDCSYRPLAATAARQAADEVRHAALGFKGLTQLCATAEGKAAAEETLQQWYPAGLDMFGRSETARQYRYIGLGLKRTPNDQLREQFRQECDAALRKLGLQPPDPAANRRYR